MTTWCKCAWPHSMRSNINLCRYCLKTIPVAEEDMTAEQVETRARLSRNWPRSESDS